MRKSPNFAVMRRLSNETMEYEIEVGLSKARYEDARLKEKENWDNVIIDSHNGKKRCLDLADMDDKERILADAKDRQVFDPVKKNFNYA